MPKHPKVTLVGKGVCFDTGGLDIKPSAGMLLMKKDMGGAANALALGAMVMDAKLPVRCACSSRRSRTRSPATPSGRGDIYTARKGITVEIGNTDAEGRLVLADALALADEEIARPADRLRDADRRRARRARPRAAAVLHRRRQRSPTTFARHAAADADPLWRMPLWKPYDSRCSTPKSPTSTTPAAASPARSRRRCSCNVSSSGQAVAPSSISMAGIRRRARPARRRRGKATRALYALLKERYQQMSFDPRVTPVRANLAATHLKGKVEAARFKSEPRVVIEMSAPLPARLGTMRRSTLKRSVASA